jgi:glc operon protein GlcG
MKQQLLRIAAVAVTTAAMAAATGAQTVPSKFVVSGAVAEKILDSTTINLATAENIAMACERAADAEKVQISVYVLDHDGNTVYMHRMDGQNWTNVATAEMKAQTALGLRAPSKQMMNDAIANRNDEWQQMKLGLFSNSGGLPIVVDHQLIGVVGVGGSRPRIAEGWSDEICGYKALNEVIGPQPPLLEDISSPRSPATVPAPRFRPTKTPTSTLPSDWVVSGEAAANIFDATQISGDAARRVAMASRKWAADHNTTMSLFILDPSGNAVHGERMDGQVNHDIKTAKLKAETARRSRQATSARYAGVTNNPTGFPRAVELFGFYDQPGGLPIVVDGQMIGAIGVSGVADGEDEACAVAGLKAVFGDRVTVPVYPQDSAR